MRIALLLSVLLALCVFTVVAADPKTESAPTPLMRTVDPYTAKVGAEVTVAGDNLGKSRVAEVYLTANKTNFKVEVLSQTDTELKFRVPSVKPGGYRITVLMKSAEPIFIEEPVRVVIE